MSQTAQIKYNQSLIGDYGDCGNFAIAYQRAFGGKLFGLYNEGVLSHIVIVKEDKIIDVYGHGSWEELYKRGDVSFYEGWGYNEMDVLKVEIDEIVKNIPFTNEIEIKKWTNFLHFINFNRKRSK